MRTEDLEYMVTVADARSLNKASTKLNIPYQSINNGIKNLENEFNITLFERSAQGTFLTDDGQKFYKFAKHILNDTHELKKYFSTTSPLQAQLSGTLTIGVSPVINHSFFPLFINKFKKVYPKIRLYINELDNNDLFSAFKNENFNIILYFANELRHDFYFPADEDSYICKAFLTAYLSKKHPLADHRSISVKTMLKYPVSVYQKNTSKIDMEIWLEKHAMLKKFFATDNYELYINSIFDDQSIAILPRFFTTHSFYVNKLSSDAVAIPVRNAPPSYFDYQIQASISPSKRNLSNIFIEEFLDFLKSF